MKAKFFIFYLVVTHFFPFHVSANDGFSDAQAYSMCRDIARAIKYNSSARLESALNLHYIVDSALAPMREKGADLNEVKLLRKRILTLAVSNFLPKFKGKDIQCLGSAALDEIPVILLIIKGEGASLFYVFEVDNGVSAKPKVVDFLNLSVGLGFVESTANLLSMLTINRNSKLPRRPGGRTPNAQLEYSKAVNFHNHSLVIKLFNERFEELTGYVNVMYYLRAALALKDDDAIEHGVELLEGYEMHRQRSAVVRALAYLKLGDPDKASIAYLQMLPEVYRDEELRSFLNKELGI